MKFKNKILLSFIIIISFSISSAIAADDAITIATDVPYKPMEYLSAEGKLTGFDIELGNAICEQANLTCRWVVQGWNGIIPGLIAHRYDAIMSNMTITDQRSNQVLFTDPYIVLGNSFYTPVDSEITEISVDALKDAKIGVQRGTIQDQYVTDEYGEIATIKRYQYADDMVVDMEVGRLDAIFISDNAGQAALMAPNPGKYHQVGPHLTRPSKYFGYGQAIAIRKGSKDLATKLNAAIKAVKENGTYDKIYKKYFDALPTSQTKYFDPATTSNNG